MTGRVLEFFIRLYVVAATGGLVTCLAAAVPDTFNHRRPRRSSQQAFLFRGDKEGWRSATTAVNAGPETAKPTALRTRKAHGDEQVYQWTSAGDVFERVFGGAAPPHPVATRGSFRQKPTVPTSAGTTVDENAAAVAATAHIRTPTTPRPAAALSPSQSPSVSNAGESTPTISTNDNEIGNPSAVGSTAITPEPDKRDKPWRAIRFIGYLYLALPWLSFPYCSEVSPGLYDLDLCFFYEASVAGLKIAMSICGLCIALSKSRSTAMVFAWMPPSMALLVVTILRIAYLGNAK